MGGYRPSTAALILITVPLTATAILSFLSYGGREDSGTGSCHPSLHGVGIAATVFLIAVLAELLRRAASR